MSAVPPKPDYYAPERARAFQDETVAGHYHLRPPYPDDLVAALAALVVDEPRTILDLGTGTGDLARRLLPAAGRVNSVGELESRGLFEVRGTQRFAQAWRPTIDEYIDCRHSQGAVPRDPDHATAFKAETRALLERLVRDGRLRADGDRLVLTVEAGIAWGVPRPRPGDHRAARELPIRTRPAGAAPPG